MMQKNVCGLCYDEWEPRRHMTADLRREKLNYNSTSDEVSQGSEGKKGKFIQTSLTQNPKFSSWRQQLGLYLDGSGLWRCGGRLNNTDLAECAKHPILHDASHHITKLIVHSCHKKAQHGGVRETLYHF